MTHVSTSAPALNDGGAIKALTAPFRAFGRALVWLAENNPRMKALRHLQETSDAALAARGLSRDSEIHRILGPMYY